MFAGVQALAANLHKFEPGRFDYVVIDEFHHAAARSYRKVIDHFQPEFLLGLTATPEPPGWCRPVGVVRGQPGLRMSSYRRHRAR